jgi:16S rRNA (cytidine1402-2'-O)-methyltransferase
MNAASQTGTLYVVATPIGNLGDVTIRMQQVLTEVDLIACEDTRHTRKLLSALKINTKMTSYYREKERRKAPYLLEKLKKGYTIAVVSDAGTPGLSDPGAFLVQATRAAGIPVIPIPGPSALTTAVSVAGLTQTSFYFGGFPPAKKGERKRLLTSLKTLHCPLIFYESPHRIRKTLHDCFTIFGDRKAQLFRELTKLHEEHLGDRLSELMEYCTTKVRGELVLVVEGCRKITDAARPENLDELILWYKKQETVSLKDAVRNIAADLDISRSQVYQRALQLWQDD